MEGLEGRKRTFRGSPGANSPKMTLARSFDVLGAALAEMLGSIERWAYLEAPHPA
jgi:hypothetical protein